MIIENISDEPEVDYLKKFDNDQLREMIEQSKLRSKKLYMRYYQITTESDQLTKNLEENHDIVQTLRKESNFFLVIIVGL